MKKTVVAAMLVCVMLASLVGGAYAEDWSLPYTGDPVTVKMLGWQSYGDFNTNDTKIAEWLRGRLGNVTIEFEIPADSTATKIEMYLASGDMPDIMVIRDNKAFMEEYGAYRALNMMDYADYMPEFMARLDVYPQLKTNTTDEDGGLYIYQPVGFDGPSVVTYQNQDLMDKYGLETPTTPEEMLACMEIVCAGEGEEMKGLAIIPWGMIYNIYTIGALFGTDGAYPSDFYYDYEAGEWTYPMLDLSDEFKAAVEFMKLMYEEGYLHPDFLSMDWDTFVTQYTGGNALFTMHYIGVGSQFTDAGINATVIVNPIVEGLTPYVETSFRSDATNWFTIINKDTEYPELCASLVEFFGSEEFAVANVWGIEGETYAVDEDGNRYYLDSYMSADADTKAQYALNNSTVGVGYVATMTNGYLSLDAKAAAYDAVDQAGATLIGEGLNNGTIKAYITNNTPVFDDNALETINLAYGSLLTYVTENITNFVLGVRDMSEWDAFLEELSNVADIDALLDIYNSAEQAGVPPQQSERTYFTP